MKPGRNDPCPCGSGKKYKHCHLLQEEVSAQEDLTWRRLQRVSEGLAERLFEAAMNHFGPTGLDEAWEEFNLWDENTDPFDPYTPHASVFVPWFLYNWRPDPEETEVPAEAHEVTAAQFHLRAAGRRMDPMLRRYVEACDAAHWSFYEVLACKPGHGFRLRDVLLGTETDVIEHSGSKGIETGMLLFAKVVPIDGIAVLDGCTPVPFPPISKTRVIDLRRELAELGKSIDAGMLREFELDLIELYLHLAEGLLNPKPPQLANTDGDPLEFHDLIFDIDSPRAAFDALRDLAVASSEEHLRAAAAFDRAGELVRAEIPWQKLGNAVHADWDNTLLGTIKIARGRLTASVNSERRASQLRPLIEERLGGAGRYRTTKVRSAQSMLKRGLSPREEAAADLREEEHARLAEMPEVKAALAEMMRKHFRAWVDQKVPALGDRTPREAMGDADGREAVEALVLQIEHDGARMKPPLDPTIVRELRETLGLEVRS